MTDQTIEYLGGANETVDLSTLTVTGTDFPLHTLSILTEWELNIPIQDVTVDDDYCYVRVGMEPEPSASDQHTIYKLPIEGLKKFKKVLDGLDV